MKLLLIIAMLALGLFAACGSNGSPVTDGEEALDQKDSGRTSGSGAVAFDGDTGGGAGRDAGGDDGFAGSVEPSAPPSGADFQVSVQGDDRKVISTASTSIEVDDVEKAATEVRLTAEVLGGFVERLSTSGGQPSRSASIIIRVPQVQFFTALERIESLGEVQSRSLQSEDVSEQFVDLEARLTSALREEASLLGLLDKAENVSEVLVVERELARVRSEVERLQGQLNFLERRVEMASIAVSLFTPGVEIGEPPSVSLTIEVSDVTGSVDTVKALVARLEGAFDRVSVSVRDGEESATLSVRVQRSDFQQAMASVEDEGKLLRKELTEGQVPAAEAADGDVEPDARLTIAFIERDGSPWGLIMVIVGAIVLALVAGLLLVRFWPVRRRPAPQGG